MVKRLSVHIVLPSCAFRDRLSFSVAQQKQQRSDQLATLFFTA